MNIHKIERELARQGWSKYALAKKLKVRPNTLYSVLQKGSFKTVEKIAQILNVPEKDLVE